MGDYPDPTLTTSEPWVDALPAEAVFPDHPASAGRGRAYPVIGECGAGLSGSKWIAPRLAVAIQPADPPAGYTRRE